MKQSDMKKPSELREKGVVELSKMRKDLEDEVFKLRFRQGSGNLKQVSSIKKTRRELARVNTIIREHEIKGQKEAGK